MEDCSSAEILNGSISLQGNFILPAAITSVSEDCKEKVLKTTANSVSNGNFKNFNEEGISLYESNNYIDTKKILHEHWECHNTGGNQFCSKQSICKDEKEKTKAQTKPIIWKCKYNCGKIFTQEKYMNNHILIMHENVNMIQCKVCLKYLSTKSRLKSHMLRHSGIKHLVCLICIHERFNELSCLRHHLLVDHDIGSKHPLFNESYYQLSLKEMALVEKTKNNEINPESAAKKRKTLSGAEQPGAGKKSALDLTELKNKIKLKSDKIKFNLKLMPKVLDNRVKAKAKDKIVTCSKTEDDMSNILQVLTAKHRKIMTAENGMKLIKLANGQFKKINSL